MKFSSSMIALVVFVLGLTAYASGQSAQQCTLECSDLSQILNTTQDVEINFGADVTIIIEQSIDLLVFLNKKTNVLIALDITSNVVFVYRLEASFGIAINIKSGLAVRVKYNITTFVNIDLTVLKAAIVKAQTDISANINTIQINLTLVVANIGYNVNKIFISGSTDIILSVTEAYGFFFDTCNKLAVTISAGIQFSGMIFVIGFGVVNDVVVRAATVIELLVELQISFSINIVLSIVTEVSKNSINLLEKLITAIEGAISAALAAGTAVHTTITALIETAKSGTSIDKSITVASVTYRFILTLVKDYLRLALQLGSINVDIGYSGDALAVFNSRANVYLVLSRSFIFLYSIELNAGLLIKGGNFVYVTKETILSKIGSNGSINSGTLALFVSKYATVVFEAGTQVALKDFKTALASEAKCVEFCVAKGIANGAVVYKVFAAYAQSISGSVIFGYSFDTVISLKVTFSLTATYQIDTACYNNAIIAAIAAALNVVQTAGSFIAAGTLFASLKIAIGG